jgi:hypothetical protein
VQYVLNIFILTLNFKLKLKNLKRFMLKSILSPIWLGGWQFICLPTSIHTARIVKNTSNAAFWRIFTTFLFSQPKGNKDFTPADLQSYSGIAGR